MADDKQTPESWREMAAKELRGKTPDDLTWQTPEGIAVKPLYTAADLEGLENQDNLPGVEPFLRGVRATMYTNRPWTIRQYAGFSTAEESNIFYRKALAGGHHGYPPANGIPELRQAVADGSAGGPFMLSSSNSIHSSCNPDNLMAMVEAAQRQ